MQLVVEELGKKRDMGGGVKEQEERERSFEGVDMTKLQCLKGQSELYYCLQLVYIILFLSISIHCRFEFSNK